MAVHSERLARRSWSVSLSVQGPRVKRGVRVGDLDVFGFGWGVRVGPSLVGGRVRAGAQPYLGPRPLWGRRHDG
jgi:hypothetical protein